MSGIMDFIRRDACSILTDTNGFVVPVIFSVTNGETVVSETCNALAVKHNITYDNIGNATVNGRQARVTVHETALQDLGYPVRNSNNRISLENHTVTWADINGVQATYSIKSVQPNETTGVIVCILNEVGTVSPPGRLIIGWMPAEIRALIKATPDADNTQTLANGDIIPLEYSLNGDNTLTIPFMVGKDKLTSFLLDNMPIQDIVYNKDTGTFDASANGGFIIDNSIAFDATIPIWQS